MNRNFFLKHAAFAGLALLGAATAFGQCAVAPANCPSTTDPFNADVFKTRTNVVYNTVGKFYEPATGNASPFSLTSYVFIVNSNNVSVTLQGSGTRLANGVTIEALDVDNNNAVLCTFSTATLAKPCATFTTLNGKRVRFRFTFTRGSNGGGITFDNFGIDPAQATLPVTFAGFTGKQTAAGLQLTWKVGGESNVSHYEVERSTTGNGGFAKIGSVAATGSSSYSFTDGEVHNGVVLYRIKNVDNDGQFRYSSLLSFRNGKGSIVFRVVPTATSGSTQVEHAAATGTEEITLATADGRTVRTQRPAAGSVKTSMDLSGLQAGIYLIKWSDGKGGVQTTKVVKQ